MSGLSIGIGVGLRCNVRNPSSDGKVTPPAYLSCFGTGIWEEEGYWFGSDTWKNEGTNTPFLSTGAWNNEGVYRFKDPFNFGASFLPTGYILFDFIYRYNDKIKIKEDVNDVLLKKNSKISLAKNKSYWNF